MCDMVEHVKVCGKVEVLCKLGCGTRVRRESILFHLESECSEESVVCPHEKYRCEVVGLKRRELKQHLEENRCLHTELKLNAMEEKIEFLEKQNETFKKETELFQGILSRHKIEVNWTVKEIHKKLKPNSDMGVKLAACSAAKSEQGIISLSFTVPCGILIKFETEHYERGSFVSF